MSLFSPAARACVTAETPYRASLVAVNTLTSRPPIIGVAHQMRGGIGERQHLRDPRVDFPKQRVSSSIDLHDAPAGCRKREIHRNRFSSAAIHSYFTRGCANVRRTCIIQSYVSSLPVLLTTPKVQAFLCLCFLLSLPLALLSRSHIGLQAVTPMIFVARRHDESKLNPRSNNPINRG